MKDIKDLFEVWNKWVKDDDRLLSEQTPAGSPLEDEEDAPPPAKPKNTGVTAGSLSTKALASSGELKQTLATAIEDLPDTSTNVKDLPDTSAKAPQTDREKVLSIGKKIGANVTPASVRSKSGAGGSLSRADEKVVQGVIDLQRRLVQAGFAPQQVNGKPFVDGIFGKNTANAITRSYYGKKVKKQ
tara:strand:- start:1155 stop:1712 length:558 start_codon:yes stop_codon:yes gene_type:complete